MFFIIIVIIVIIAAIIMIVFAIAVVNMDRGTTIIKIIVRAEIWVSKNAISAIILIELYLITNMFVLFILLMSMVQSFITAIIIVIDVIIIGVD